MFDRFVQLDESHLVFLAVLAVIATVAITILSAIVAVQIRKLRERQLELGFKDDLLRRGYSIDEIVRTVSSARPTRSQSLMALGDWAILKLSNCGRTIAVGMSEVSRLCRRLLHSAWHEGSHISRLAWCHSRIRGREAWVHGSHFCRGLWRESRPILRRSMTSVSRGVHWLVDQSDRLIRRFATHQP